MTRGKRNGLSAALIFGVVLFLLTVQAAAAGQANVFIYHRFDDSRFPSTNISSRDFQSHLEVLRRQDFTVLTLGQIMDKIKHGESLPQRCAAITVDDAYRSFLTAGWPLLKSYGFPATLFVSTDLVGGGDYLEWQELKTLHDEGVELGNHSASHAYLLDGVKNQDWVAWVRQDIDRAQQAFASNLGFKPRFFAYPFGESSAYIRNEYFPKRADEHGCLAAIGTDPGLVSAHSDRWNLPRFVCGRDWSAPAELLAVLGL